MNLMELVLLVCFLFLIYRVLRPVQQSIENGLVKFFGRWMREKGWIVDATVVSEKRED